MRGTVDGNRKEINRQTSWNHDENLAGTVDHTDAFLYDSSSNFVRLWFWLGAEVAPLRQSAVWQLLGRVYLLLRCKSSTGVRQVHLRNKITRAVEFRLTSIELE